MPISSYSTNLRKRVMKRLAPHVGVMVDLGVFTVNLADKGTDAYARVAITLELSNEKVKEGGVRNIYFTKFVVRGCSKNPLLGPSPQPQRELTLSSPYPTPLPPTRASEEKGLSARPFQG